MTDPAVLDRIRAMVLARGAEYERTIEQRRKRERDRDRERKREARKVQTVEQRESERERDRKRRATRPLRPFIAIDGEGAGTDTIGRQPYILMCAADASGSFARTLHSDGRPLRVDQCLEFLLPLPPASKAILVGFGIGYDATQILRGIGRQETLRRIFPPDGKGPRGKTGDPLPVFWGNYAITYQQGQYLRVARTVRDANGKGQIVKGSSRTVYETLGFFQCKFAKAITDFDFGTPEERAIIDENKALRGTEGFVFGDEMIRYCTLESRLLAMLMTKFREDCYATPIRPKQWSGAGQLASALLEQHRVPKRPSTRRELDALAEAEATKAAQRAAAGKAPKPPKPQGSGYPRRPERDPAFEVAANAAYYGGRTEISRVGRIEGPVFEYDRRSAYPAEMPGLPCPLHTVWEHRPRARTLPADGFYVAKIRFLHGDDGPWCGLPFRPKGDNAICWPRMGSGWYWSVEIDAACCSLGARIVAVLDLWLAHQRCDCRLFDWVPGIFEKRRELEASSKGRGVPLKLALNSLYGKNAQRSGKGPFHDPVTAGLITAGTRARLVEAIGKNPEAAVMLATDAVFSSTPFDLDIGSGLGQWERKEWPDLFIAQPGVYWCPTKVGELTKSRGAPRSVIGPATPRFEKVFEDWLAEMRQPPAEPQSGALFKGRRDGLRADAVEIMLRERLIPSVPVTIPIFTGCRSALARGKSWLAGRWTDDTRLASFEWRSKRAAMEIELCGQSLKLFPRTGDLFVESAGYQPADFDRLIAVTDADGDTAEIDENTLLEAMPDHLDFLPHE